MSQLASELKEENKALAERVRRMEELQRIHAALLILFARRDEEAADKQRVIRMALGLE